MNVLPVERGNHIDERLYDLLTTTTPHGTEELLVKYMPNGYVQLGGNLIYFLGKKTKHRTMFSCHMDTVHREQEKIHLVDKLADNGERTGYIYAAKYNGEEYIKSILGADDKVGMYIMLRMMEAGIPGMYIFHVGEEKGCIGSRYLLDKHPSLFRNIDRCIAFDRHGYGDVVEFQRGRRCASIEFSSELARQLNDNTPPGVRYAPARGVYTDSATYMEVIPECSNISVGYFNEHTSDEYFDNIFLEVNLIPALEAVEWSELPVKRDPKVTPIYSSSYTSVTSVLPWKAVVVDTNWKFIPPLKLSDGVPAGASRIALRAALHKKMAVSGFDTLISEVIDLMFEYERVKHEYEEVIGENERLERMAEYTGYEYEYPYPYN